MDWNYFKYIEAIAATGTLSDAAKQLGMDQSTLSRNLQKIDEEFGVKIFKKSSSGYSPTSEGEAVLRSCRDMKTVVDGFESQTADIKRLVVTSIDSFFSHYLLKRIEPFDFQIEFVETDKNLNLARREADFAIRFDKPSHGELVIKKLCEVGFAVYRAKESTEFAKTPAIECPWIILNDNFGTIADQKWLKGEMKNAKVLFCVTSYQQILAAVGHGSGVGILPCYVGDEDKDLVRMPIGDGRPVFYRQVWMVIHPNSGRAREIKQFKAWLIKQIGRDEKFLSGN